METRDDSPGTAPDDGAGTADGGISGVIGDLRRLAGEARTFVEAEAAYQASRAKVVAGSVGKIAGFVGVAAVLAVFALFALVMGLLLGLATLVGPWLATAIVVAVVGLVVLVLALAARARWRRMMALVFPEAAGGDGS